MMNKASFFLNVSKNGKKSMHAYRCFSSRNVFEDDQSSKRTVVGESPWKLGNRDHSLIETREKSNRRDIELYQTGLEHNINEL